MFSKNVFTYCEKKLLILRSLEQCIQTVQKGQYNFWNGIIFWLVPGDFSDLIHLNNSNWKNNWDLDAYRKVRKQDYVFILKVMGTQKPLILTNQNKTKGQKKICVVQKY